MGGGDRDTKRREEVGREERSVFKIQYIHIGVFLKTEIF